MEHAIALERLGLTWREKESSVEDALSGLGEVAGRADREATVPESTPGEAAELLAGFLARRPAAQNAFIELLRPLFRQEIRRDFPSLMPHSEDLQQSALLKLCELREDPVEVVRIRLPLDELVKYLMNAPARVLMRSGKKARVSLELQDWDASSQGNQEDATYVRELWRLIARLPFKLGRTPAASRRARVRRRSGASRRFSESRRTPARRKIAWMPRMRFSPFRAARPTMSDASKKHHRQKDLLAHVQGFLDPQQQQELEEHLRTC